jgi:flagellin-like protein
MQRGISPIVAIVLLIAIAVIAAVGVYFWVGGLVTQQPTAEKPIVINANGVYCGVINSTDEWATVMVSNLDAYRDINEALYISSDRGKITVAAADTNIPSSGQKEMNFTAGNFTKGRPYVLYGTKVSQANLFIPQGNC